MMRGDKGTESGGPAFNGFACPVFVVLLSVFIALRIIDLHYTFWNDEVFSVRIARLGWGIRFLEEIANDLVHPPLFYVALKGWMAIGGESPEWLRLLPVSIAVLTILPFVALCRELRFSANDLNLGFLLMATNWFLASQAPDIRMYMLLLFFATTSFWLFLKVLRKEAKDYRALCLLCLANIGLVYTHYYGWLVVGVEVCYAIIAGARQSLTVIANLALVVLLVILCFIPWALAVVHSFQSVGSLQRNLGFIARPDVKDVLWFYVKLNGIFMSEWRTVRWAAVAGLLLFGYPVVLWARDIIVESWRGEGSEDGIFWFLVLGASVPVGIAFLASHVLNVAVWGDRYLIVAAIPYLLLVAHSANRLTPRWLRVTTVTLMVIWVSLAGLQGTMRQRFSWGYVVQEMRNAESPSTTGRRLIAIATFSCQPVRYYLEQANDRRFTLEVVGNDDLERHIGIGRPNASSIWIAYGDAGSRQGKAPEDVLLAKGYSLGERFESGTQGNKVVVFRACWPSCTTGAR